MPRTHRSHRSDDSDDNDTPTLPGYAKALWAITLVFGLRIVGQQFELGLPESAGRWRGDSAVYWLLILLQLPILAVMITVAGRHSLGSVPRNPALGQAQLLIGSGYCAAMAARLAIGLLDASTGGWFHEPIAISFHIVLAAFILVLAAFHLHWIGGEVKALRRREPQRPWWLDR